MKDRDPSDLERYLRYKHPAALKPLARRIASLLAHDPEFQKRLAKMLDDFPETIADEIRLLTKKVEKGNGHANGHS